jgi:hypothetical protein
MYNDNSTYSLNARSSFSNLLTKHFFLYTKAICKSQIILPSKILGSNIVYLHKILPLKLGGGLNDLVLNTVVHCSNAIEKLYEINTIGTGNTHNAH